jgi:hypothetical protein
LLAFKGGVSRVPENGLLWGEVETDFPQLHLINWNGKARALSWRRPKFSPAIASRMAGDDEAWNYLEGFGEALQSFECFLKSRVQFVGLGA